MSTGVTADPEVTSAFAEFKLKKEGENKVRYFIYKIENKKKIIIESKGSLDKTYDDFVAALPESESRFGLIDLDFLTADGRPTSKMVFITWNPDTGSPFAKMLYSGSKEALKAELNGVGIHINATDYGELDLEESILPVVRRFG